MKALAIQQPYATLLTLGEKRVETRSWQPTTLRPGELLAIHAAKNWWRGEIGGRELAATDPFASALARGCSRGLLASPDPTDLPRGCVLAVARFVRCIPTDGPEAAHLSAQERAFGFYGPGRFGWVLEEVRPLREPIPAKGMLGLWEWEPPTDLEARLLEG